MPVANQPSSSPAAAEPPGSEDRPLLRVLSCGSVDDGKSTLIGRLLHDCGVLYEDQLALLENERTAEGLPDFSRLLDGLLAEREQAITIDVAHRSFTTSRRRFLVADAPGHESYTRNMATAASRADLALLLVDAVRARDGLSPQTIRHAVIASLMGVPDMVVAVNKMDRLEYNREVFAALEGEFRRRIRNLPFRSVVCVPTSALRGDNVCRASAAMSSWYRGPTILELLESLEPPDRSEGPLLLPVQWVARAPGVRGLAGTIVSGRVEAGRKVFFSPSGQRGTVKRLLSPAGDRKSAGPEEAVCLQLEEDLDVGRGEVASDPEQPPELANQLSARVAWLNDPPLVAGRTYLFRLAASEARATVTELSSRLDLNHLEDRPAKELHANDVGRIKLILDRSLPVAPYGRNRDLGGFLLIDSLSSETLGAGMIDFALRRSHNVFWHDFRLDRAAHAAQKGQTPATLWFTGLSGSGKSTLAGLAGRRLHAAGRHVYILDGDNLRHGLNRDLGFGEHDRAENVRRASEVARLMNDAGLIVLASFISPYRADREAVRGLFPAGGFFEIYVDTPLEICARRDPKGLYAKAFKGELPNFTGVNAPFEPPLNPDLRLDGEETPEKLTERILDFLAERLN